MRRWIALLSVIVTCLVTWTSPLSAQAEWRCDGGPNDILAAAQTARDAGDPESAWWLAARAELICLGQPDRYAEAQRLRRQLEPSYTRMVQEAVPGRVDLGDFSLFMVCLGEGSPTGIFENGAGASARHTWAHVQPAISTVTRACRYDRLGTPPSSPLPWDAVRTTQNHVDELIALLEAAEIEPPYVLVGHSLAGLNALLFTNQHPDLVAGIVLADVMHPDWPARVAVADPDFMVLPPGIEQLDLEASIRQMADIEGFGDRPLAVVSGGSDDFAEAVGVPFNEAAFHEWIALQHEWATYSTNNRYMPADRAGHGVPWTRPDTIIEAVLWVLDEVHATEAGE